MASCTCASVFKPCCPNSGHNRAAVRDATPLSVGHEGLRTSLQRRLAGLHVAFVGDSVVRQYYELLACFLGLERPRRGLRAVRAAGCSITGCTSPDLAEMAVLDE